MKHFRKCHEIYTGYSTHSEFGNPYAGGRHPQLYQEDGIVSVAISIKDAVKKYGSNTIIPKLSLTIKEGEFFTLLGPSGCGKTTLLRMIAGFNSIEGGDFFFNKKRINDLDPAKRNIGMVFQNYAIFPHYTVRQNVEFGLKNQKVPAEERRVRTDKFLKLMQIEALAERRPDRMSGGQQQRVALARALVIEPDVLLMDEPLSNLDAKLRVEMRSAIRRTQNQIGITTVYVTHDQEEAMAISDRIGVMNGGVLQQIGTPQSIYQRPANLFVSTFIGRSNILDGTLEMEEGKTWLVLENGGKVLLDNVKEPYRKNQSVKISVRPEELLLCGKEEGVVRAKITESIFLGLNTHYTVELEKGGSVEIIQESTLTSILKVGEEISLNINTQKVNVFTSDGNTNILTGVSNDMEHKGAV